MTINSVPPPSSVASQLERANTAISNALEDPAIATLLAGVGYDQATLEAGQALYEQAHDLNRTQEREYGEQNAATAALEAARQQADTTYMGFLKIARVALKGDHQAITALGLVGTRKISLTGWLDQACQFYTNALETPAVLTKLARYNITQTRLEAGKAEVDAVLAARHTQERERGDAQTSTKVRDAALDALNEWVGDFIEIARVALAGQPQLLEKLGIRVAS